MDIALYGNNKDACGVVKLRDTEIYYETYGSGKPLLLLHGNNQSINAFVNQIGEYSKSYQVIAVDTRGQGNSTDLSTGALTYDLFADDMIALMDELKISNAYILGWSDGGITGLILAIKYPAYVGKLAVMGANIFPTDMALKDIVFNDVHAKLARLKGKTDQYSIEQKRLNELVLNEPHLTFEDVRKIKAATLVMAGENDVVLDSHTREIASNIPNAQLITFKDADHFAPYCEHIKFNEAVLKFFGESSSNLFSRIFGNPGK